MNSKRRKVLAIGLDAAAPAFVRTLIEQGQMPHLQKLLSRGRWMRVESTAYIGSGSVWPTFITGHDPTVHGVYGEWVWQPQRMGVTRYSGNDLPPFWQNFEKQQLKIGILDSPFMPMVGLSDGFEISEWGPHDVIEGKTVAGPPAVERILEAHPRHPGAFGTSISGPDDYNNLQKLAEACVEGAKLRGALARSLITQTHPDFCLIVFPETHRSGHYLWHTVQMDHALYRENGFTKLTSTEPWLTNIYQEIDTQIGEILKTFPDDSAIMVFSLHGMQPSHGVPAFLGSVLLDAGFTTLTEWSDQSRSDRVRTVIANIKRLLPAPAKKIYYSIVPATTAHMVARSTLLPHYDWSRTRAFALPTDQHGWIRINLIGREAQGIVPLEEYEKTCDEIEKLVCELTSEDGRPLIRKTSRTATSAEEALRQSIPDLIIHWEDAVFASPLKIKGLPKTPENVGRKYVGQHSLEGFCILAVDSSIEIPDTLAAADMGGLITSLLGSTVSVPRV
jgi:predicted AlkP superfamily phosphohydrolase/phosphomutase